MRRICIIILAIIIFHCSSYSQTDLSPLSLEEECKNNEEEHKPGMSSYECNKRGGIVVCGTCPPLKCPEGTVEIGWVNDMDCVCALCCEPIITIEDKRTKRIFDIIKEKENYEKIILTPQPLKEVND